MTFEELHKNERNNGTHNYFLTSKEVASFYFNAGLERAIEVVEQDKGWQTDSKYRHRTVEALRREIKS